jgi:riboflavin kinase / FMN adenylyltransferase
MNVYYNLKDIPKFTKAVVTIGTFDGVHMGHMQIINQLKQAALQVGGQSVIITFDPHPRQVISSTSLPIQLLNTLPEKIKLLSEKGIHHLVVVPFTTQFMVQEPLDYIRNFLVKYFEPNTIIIGYDHRFGHQRLGDINMLKTYAPTYKYQLIEIPKQVLEDVAISSTRIRKALEMGQLNVANELLGYPYFFEGQVVEGNKMGRTIGYPTANIKIDNAQKLVPANGVYAVQVSMPQSEAQQAFGGMMNIGLRPTINGTALTIEVHIFDFDATIYGSTLQIKVLGFLRHEVKFSGLDALKQQLAKDAIDAQAVLQKNLV